MLSSTSKASHSCAAAPSLLAALFAILSASCAVSPSAAVLQDADHGPAPVGTSHHRAIRDAFAEFLIDPGSAQWEFAEPEKGWGRDDSDASYVFGWVVVTRINSKNQFGAFTGWRDYKVLLTDGAVHSLYVPKGDDLLGNPRFERLR